MPASTYLPADPEGREWDVIIVGCGMGGGTLGYELSRRGRSVLFVEKGHLIHDHDLASAQAEPGIDAEIDARLRTGRWPLRLKGHTTFGDLEFYAPLGCGSAGSTGLYGAQLERFRPADFRPRERYPRAPDSTLPEAWPVTYQEMLPHYRRAEKLFRVCGTDDPLAPDPEAELRTPPALSERDQFLKQSLEAAGLHPYRSHVGLQYIEGCDECIDFCPRGCKSDVGHVCLLPALDDHGARLLTRCEVIRINAQGRRVTGLDALWQERELRLRGRIVVIAAGAYMTPVLLMRSTSRDCPDGLANSSGLIGRNLMLHASNFLMVDSGEPRSAEGPRKALSLTDFYDADGEKLGALQSVGLPVIPPFIEAYLHWVEQRDPQWWRQHAEPLIPQIAETAARAFQFASPMVTILEDLPYSDNRIIMDPTAPNGMRFEYTFTEELARRSEQFCKQLTRRLAPKLRVTDVTWAKNNINYGHVCGTCRFGDDPTASVLDRDNRAHDLDNLYVVDASFFPSSGATNPALTIAANALRVGGVINSRL